MENVDHQSEVYGGGFVMSKKRKTYNVVELSCVEDAMMCLMLGIVF